MDSKVKYIQGQLWKRFLFIVCVCVSPFSLTAIPLTSYFEVQLIKNVSDTWVTVNLDNTYTNAIPICTYNLISNTSVPAVPRIRNIQNSVNSSFELKIQDLSPSGIAAQGDVHCMIIDEGSYNMGGLNIEAHTVESTGTMGNNADGWGDGPREGDPVPLQRDLGYTTPVVHGQVISSNDTEPSVFHSDDCENRANRPFQTNLADGFCVGKHIGKEIGTRVNETIGYMIVESGTAVVNGVEIRSVRGGDSIRGVTPNPPNSYNTVNTYNIGVATQLAEDGGDGGWAVLYGDDPLANNQIDLAI